MWMLFLLSALVGAGGAGGAEEAPGAPQQLPALHCPPCDRIHCSSRRALRLQCKGGVTTGVCGCCPACARTQGESCGGAWDYLGKCDQGLVCAHLEGAGEPRGTCTPVVEPLDPETCHPECTRDYCQANPSHICSARFVSAEGRAEGRACQGSCQHTSCSSCLLLRPPACPQACAPADSSCLRRFGKCVHNHLTAGAGAVCHSGLQNNPGGLFVCLVPACQTP